MAFKTLTIKKDVYNNLSRVKRPGESFSELFERLVKERPARLEEFYGAWKLERGEEDKVLAAMRKFRKEFDESFKAHESSG